MPKQQPHIQFEPAAEGYLPSHPRAKWTRVMEALQALYEKYCMARVPPRRKGFDDEVDILMEAYDAWLD